MLVLGCRRPSDGATDGFWVERGALTSKPKRIKRSGRTMYLSQGCSSRLWAYIASFYRFGSQIFPIVAFGTGAYNLSQFWVLENGRGRV